ncbi:MAG TPA: sigma 54-interacting transcriptional regulator [Polyangiaceae bacterium]|nr:sigma 54-interacting transcriptional regulator [Polyangiaceae bacterium]
MKRAVTEDELGSQQTEPTTQRALAPPQLELVIEREGGKAATRSSLLDGDVLRIGSHPSNEVILADTRVSRFHCQLRAHPKGWRIVDTGSLNGTRVGGVSIRDADVALPSCRIELGDSVLFVRTTNQPSNAASHASRSPAFGTLYGMSPIMRRVFARLEKIAQADGDVLIEGESGTGKELIAGEIVQRSSRAAKPLIIVDCGAISPTLVESELFGHARGAFTGADKARIGAFEAAEGGTVFLDEIGELPIEIQPKLLRALAAREVRRMGENHARPIDVRVIAATNRRLEDEINSGRFREDLYFRLGVLRVDVPPLRERLEDLPVLVGAFLERLGRTDKMVEFTDAVFEEMRGHNWPGNVRELRNFVERFVVFDEHEIAGARASAPPPAPNGPEAEPAEITVPFRQAKDRTIEGFERRYLTALLAWSHGNVSKAARKANLDRMYLHRLLQRHGIRRGEPLGD